MRKLLKGIGLLKEKYEKKDKYCWLFCSYNGKYCDSPKVVSEIVHSINSEIKIFWLLEEKYFNDVPSYIEKINIKNKEEIFKIKSKASIIIDNICGPNAIFLFQGNFIKKIKFKIKKFFNYKKGQKVISFWHGTPLKYGINQNPSLLTLDMSFGNNYFLLDSKISEQIISFQFKKAKPKIILCQAPRNYFVNQKYNINELKNALNLPLDKKIVLYAPTFRGENDSSIVDILNSGYNQLLLMDINKLLETLNLKFGGDFILVLRFHQLALKSLSKVKLDKKYIGKVYLGNKSLETTDYLKIADVLISDYSSISFDYMHTNNPIFLFTPDYTNYIKKRGLNINLKSAPFAIAKNFDELLSNITFFNSELYLNKIQDYCKKAGFCDYSKLNDEAINLIFKIAKI